MADSDEARRRRRDAVLRGTKRLHRDLERETGDAADLERERNKAAQGESGGSGDGQSEEREHHRFPWQRGAFGAGGGSDLGTHVGVAGLHRGRQPGKSAPHYRPPSEPEGLEPPGLL